MLSKITSRLSFANVGATLALLFAMSGGAIAAQHYLITSTRQISPNVLKALKTNLVLSPNQLSPRVLKALKGVTGRTGNPGTNGSQGANGVTFACNGRELLERKEKPEIERLAWPGVLPSGKTETGTWGFTSHSEGSTRVPISFTVRTAEPLAETLGRGPVELLEPGEEDPIDAHPNCPGTVQEPKAEPGFLCVYSETLEAALAGQGQMRTSGVVLTFDSQNSSPETDEGSWAMTAP